MGSDLTAVVWDFDGTLVDTRAKNLAVTRALVEHVRRIPADTCAALRSVADYETALQSHGNWKDFYRTELGMSDEEVLHAGSRWMEFQLADETEAPAYDGVHEVLEHFADLPHGIVSLNARENIVRFLERLGIHGHFDEVLGYEAVEIDRQKPEPDALVMCIERLTELRPGRVIYVGDHETDTRCAHATNAHFRTRQLEIEVIAVGAFYGSELDDSGWTVRPHVRARDPRDILGALGAGLPSAIG